MIKILFSLMLLFSGPLVFAESFEEMCEKSKGGSAQNLSFYNCVKDENPSSLKMLQKLSASLGRKECMLYLQGIKKSTYKEEDFQVLDQDTKEARSLKCYCQEKLGKGLCQNKDKFEKHVEALTRPYQIKAWGSFLQNLFTKSRRGGILCVKEISTYADEQGCTSILDEIHSDSKKYKFNGAFSEEDNLIFNENSLEDIISRLTKERKPKEGFVVEILSSSPDSNNKEAFLNDFKEKIKNENDFFNLKTSEYEKKVEELGQGKYLEEFKKVLRSEDPEKALRENYTRGIDYFSYQDKNKGEELKKRVILSSHPDLKWLFGTNTHFGAVDRKKQRAKFLKLSQTAKENEFATLKELKQKIDANEGSDCAQIKSDLSKICKMNGEDNLAITRSLKSSHELEKATDLILTEEYEISNNLKDALSEIACFQIPNNEMIDTSQITDLLGGTLSPLINLQGFVHISKIEAKVESAVDRVNGLEDTAKRIEKAKIEAKDLKGTVSLDLKFKDYLNKLTLPNGQKFSYSGNDNAQAIAAYKRQVYNWADGAIEKRISNIQGETERIVKSDMAPAEKKRKLERLLNEVQRLNNSDFLEEIYQEKRNIADYISRYEDEKANWEAQYGAEAKANPKAVQPVAPSRKQTRSAGSGGSNSYKGIAGTSAGNIQAAGTTSGIDEAQAYIPPAPSVPFAQGSLLTRIVPKNEFQDSTVKANLLAKHKGFPIAVLDEKALKVELYTPEEGTSYKLQETLTISEAEARGYVFPEDVKKLVASYKKDKKKGRAPASFIEYEPTKEELKNKKKNLEKLQSLSDVMERQGIPRRSRVVRLNSILDNI